MGAMLHLFVIDLMGCGVAPNIEPAYPGHRVPCRVAMLDGIEYETATHTCVVDDDSALDMDVDESLPVPVDNPTDGVPYVPLDRWEPPPSVQRFEAQYSNSNHMSAPAAALPVHELENGAAMVR